MDFYMTLQDILFPAFNLLAIILSLYQIRRYYCIFGFITRRYAIFMPVLVYFGIVYFLFLLGIIDNVSIWLRGPLVLLLAYPGYSVYESLKVIKRIQKANGKIEETIE